MMMMTMKMINCALLLQAYAVVVSIPKTRNYRVVFHYALRNNLRTSAKVKFFPKGKVIRCLTLNGLYNAKSLVFVNQWSGKKNR